MRSTRSTLASNRHVKVAAALMRTAMTAALSGAAVGRGILITAAVYVTILLVRLGFLTVTIYVIQALDRRPAQRLLRTTARGRVVSMTAGFRGAVSLAIALAVPTTLVGGTVFAARDMIMFVTAGAVFASLIVQGVRLDIEEVRLAGQTEVD